MFSKLGRKKREKKKEKKKKEKKKTSWSIKFHLKN